ncbi:MAG TPA: imidazole glycerol phosphate synthase subunit HisH [Devosia sp.]|jgi:glutamine amidotransferase|uniref:imidazole glycerol phosphate synthase subunit HisH n=1 Tax=Devosia sp. TaxID=1871048 RepID=UPI002F94F63A
MITIVDYGLGNIKAFSNMYKRLNIETRLARSSDELLGATKLILPGVGHFDHAMDLLDASGMRSTLDDLVLNKRVPVVGICVGMQILANGSDEGTRRGLGWIPGHVQSLRKLPIGNDMPLPHMGWNDVSATHSFDLFAGLETDARFYFLHSFYFAAANQNDVAATAHYGQDFPCIVHSGNVSGVQFHPEKSHHWGARLLKNFAEL